MLKIKVIVSGDPDEIPHDEPMTVELEVLTEELTAEQQAVLSAVLLDNYDATQIGLSMDTDDIIPQATVRRGKRRVPVSKGMYTRPLALREASMPALKEGLDTMLKEQRSTREAIKDLGESMTRLAADCLEAGGVPGSWDFVYYRDPKTGEIKHQGYEGEYPLAPHVVVARVPITVIPAGLGVGRNFGELLDEVNVLRQQLKESANAEADKLLPAVTLKLEALEALEKLQPPDSLRIIALGGKPRVLFVLPGGACLDLVASTDKPCESVFRIEIGEGEGKDEGLVILTYFDRWLFASTDGSPLFPKKAEHPTNDGGSFESYELTVAVPEDASLIQINDRTVWTRKEQAEGRDAVEEA